MLYLMLGNLIYKKTKHLSGLDQEFQAAHIQMEFCIETFDPKAKHFSEEKKRLYTMRGMSGGNESAVVGVSVMVLRKCCASTAPALQYQDVTTFDSSRTTSWRREDMKRV